jgi:hypothetical protein
LACGSLVYRGQCIDGALTLDHPLTMFANLRAHMMTVALLSLMVIPLAATADDREGLGGGHSRRSIPEFDPSTVGAIAALIAGGGILLARRRR